MEMPDFSVNAIIAGIIFGLIGGWLFREAKKRTCAELYFVGLALMLYPYFFANAVAVWFIGIALCAIAFKILQG